MLFNSLPFMVLAVVVVVLVFCFRRFGVQVPKYFVICVSLGFYTIWNPGDLPFLLISLCMNLMFSRLLLCKREANSWVLAVAILTNVLYLFAFKFLGVVSVGVNSLWSGFPVVEDLALPLGISFFTFQQIAYLVGVYRNREVAKTSDYMFVVTFFPHIVAGPLVRHSDMIKQLNRPSVFSFRAANVFGGCGLFVLGLSKKVLVADPLGVVSYRLFSAADNGQTLDVLCSWVAAISGFLNFYFDFSAYSDMACGLALIIGIRLPLNFYSPLKAVTMDEFWQRWNITVTSFIREYVFRPLAGKRLVVYRHLAALPITMVVAGVWHGSGLNFLVWGLLHGALVTFDHTRRLVFRTKPLDKRSKAYKVISWSKTQFFLIVLGCVFQAKSLESAWVLIKGMFGVGGEPDVVLLEPSIHPLWYSGLQILTGQKLAALSSDLMPLVEAICLILIAWAIALFAPNSIQIMRRFHPVQDTTRLLRKGRLSKQRDNHLFEAKPNVKWAIFFSVIFCLALLRVFSSAPSPFNYYNF